MSWQIQLNDFVQNTNKFQIQLINIPFHPNVAYHLDQNIIVSTSRNQEAILKYKFYFINGNIIEYMSKLSEGFNKMIKMYEGRMIFYKNWIIVRFYNQLQQINADSLNDGCIISKFQGNIQIFKQVSVKSCLLQIFQISKIYQLRNLQKFQRIFHKTLHQCYLTQIQYCKYVVQTFTEQNSYYYNTNLTKQIRKSTKKWQNEPILNENLLLNVIKRRDSLVKIEVYDICSMRMRGIIATQARSDNFYRRCLYIKDHKIIAILFTIRLDLYDSVSLKLIGREQLSDQGMNAEMMEYDQKKGLRIFF